MLIWHDFFLFWKNMVKSVKTETEKNRHRHVETDKTNIEKTLDKGVWMVRCYLRIVRSNVTGISCMLFVYNDKSLIIKYHLLIMDTQCIGVDITCRRLSSYFNALSMWLIYTHIFVSIYSFYSFYSFNSFCTLMRTDGRKTK